MNTQEQEALVEDYQNGANLIELFKKYRTTYKTVVKILDERGIDHSRSGRKKGKSNTHNMRVLSSEEEKIVCEIYQQTGRIKDAEVAINSGQDVVRRCLKKYGLYRTQKEATEKTCDNLRKYPVVDDYFSRENADMAYILGFLAADGNVSKKENTIKIALSSVDVDFLEEIHKRIGGRPIKIFMNNKGYNVAEWSVSSRKIKQDLCVYNIVPNKTFTYTFPTNLNFLYWRDFIRGYFDGDGTVCMAGTGALRVSLGSANKDVLEKTIDFFASQGVPKVSIYERRRENEHPYYYFQYSNNAVRQIYEILYYDGCFYLPRKRNKFEELIQSVKKM